MSFDAQFQRLYLRQKYKSSKYVYIIICVHYYMCTLLYETRMTASVLKQDPNIEKVQKSAILIKVGRFGLAVRR